MKTALYKSHQKLGATFTEFAGVTMPLKYTTIKEEHKIVREEVGMFDVSHMGECKIIGPEAQLYLEHVFTNNISSLKNGQVRYGMLCYPNGTVVDDVLVYKESDDSYMMVLNASNIEKDIKWLISNTDDYDVSIKNISEKLSEIAIQGPNAETVLKPLFNQLEELRFFHFKKIVYKSFELIISRTGYTGEDGFEVYGSHEAIINVWEQLLEKGVTPVGLGARDTLRFEVNLPLYGHELTDQWTPLEAGYSFAVDLSKDFIGASVMREQKGNLKRRTCGLMLTKKGVMRQGYPVFSENTQVGFITTGYLGISTPGSFAIAMVDTPYFKLGTELEVDIRGKRYACHVVKKQFHQKKYKK
jgi:aminomethyltransferase